MRLASIFPTTGAVLTAALLGFASAAHASATIDLIWAQNGTESLYGGGISSAITLKVILTAGPSGSWGAGVSVDYSGVGSGVLDVTGYANTPGGPLPLVSGSPTDTGDRVENISSISFPPNLGTGLAAGQSHQLGTVTFHLASWANGAWDIRSDANSAADFVLNGDGIDITRTSTFNSAFLILPAYDIGCFIDKKCSVGGSAPADSCTAQPGEEVTYYYDWDSQAGGADIYDDKLGYIGRASSVDRLTRTTTLTETTTNVAWYEVIGPDSCAFENFEDQLTVTVPTPTPTATPAATPTPPPLSCATQWPNVFIYTQAKGQSPTNNAKLTHWIRGHIIDPGSLGDTAHRIEVCAGTEVRARVTDTTGIPVIIASGSLACSSAACLGIVNTTEKYQSISQDGRDKDAITFIPR